MIRRFALAVAVATLSLAAMVPAATPPMPVFATLTAGERAPVLAGTTLAGSPWSLASLKGKRVVLDFGSVICLPCRQTLVMLGGLVEPLRRRGIEVLYVNLDGTRREKTVREFLSKEAPALIALMDPGEIAPRFGASEIPYLVVIAPDGTVAATHVGQPESAEALLKLIEGE